jgi:murein DD-endopeptidase MepM/ murein hydrolase activator NlpD
MKHSLNDFDADVRETAHQLSTADFSPQSRRRDSLRATLIEQIGMRQSHSQRMASQPRSRVYAVMGTLAASLIVGMIVMMQSRGPTPLTEMIIPITPAVAPTAIPIEMLPHFYDSIEYAAAVVPKTVFTPTWLPEDYVFNFSALSSPAKSLTTLTSLYVKATPWRASLLEGFPPYRFTGEADYLYIAQEINNPREVSPIWNLPPEMSMTEEELPDLVNSRDASDDNSYSSFSKGQYKIVLWRANSEFFLLISRLLDYPDLLRIAESLEPVTTTLFTSPPGPGHCDVSGPGENPTLAWGLPLQKGTYEYIRGMYSGHSGVDLKAVQDSPVYAANSGTVVYAGWSEYGYGNTIIISHGDVLTMYAHLNTVGVICGQIVEAGQSIGAVGSTGNSSGPHLHFEMIEAEGGVRIDPDQKFDF